MNSPLGMNAFTAPVIASGIARPPAGKIALDVQPFEIRLGDLIPFSDGIGRGVLDMRVVGPGCSHRRLVFADLGPVTVAQKVRVYRSWESFNLAVRE